MPPIPIEAKRFQAYLELPDCLGFIRHLPVGDESVFLAIPAPFEQLLLAYEIFLPYNWKDPRRIHEVAMYIARIELRTWQYSGLDRIVNPLAMRLADLTAYEMAARLIAPRPWVDDMVQQFGTSRRALERAARSISIPVACMRTTLAAPESPVADAIHRHVRELTGHPWFLPAELRHRYPNDRW